LASFSIIVSTISILKTRVRQRGKHTNCRSYWSVSNSVWYATVHITVVFSITLAITATSQRSAACTFKRCISACHAPMTLDCMHADEEANRLCNVINFKFVSHTSQEACITSWQNQINQWTKRQLRVTALDFLCCAVSCIRKSNSCRLMSPAGYADSANDH
jgi:hypothetical protein